MYRNQRNSNTLARLKRGTTAKKDSSGGVSGISILSSDLCGSNSFNDDRCDVTVSAGRHDADIDSHSPREGIGDGEDDTPTEHHRSVFENFDCWDFCIGDTTEEKPCPIFNTFSSVSHLYSVRRYSYDNILGNRNTSSNITNHVSPSTSQAGTLGIQNTSSETAVLVPSRASTTSGSFLPVRTNILVNQNNSSDTAGQVSPNTGGEELFARTSTSSSVDPDPLQDEADDPEEEEGPSQADNPTSMKWWTRSSKLFIVAVMFVRDICTFFIRGGLSTCLFFIDTIVMAFGLLSQQLMFIPGFWLVHYAVRCVVYVFGILVWVLYHAVELVVYLPLVPKIIYVSLLALAYSQMPEYVDQVLYAVYYFSKKFLNIFQFFYTGDFPLT